MSIKRHDYYYRISRLFKHFLSMERSSQPTPRIETENNYNRFVDCYGTANRVTSSSSEQETENNRQESTTRVSSDNFPPLNIGKLANYRATRSNRRDTSVNKWIKRTGDQTKFEKRRRIKKKDDAKWCNDRRTREEHRRKRRRKPGKNWKYSSRGCFFNDVKERLENL